MSSSEPRSPHLFWVHCNRCAASFQSGAFRGFKNTYDNNPIGCLQERMQK